MTTNTALRVLHVIDSLAPGGAERMVVDLANVGRRHGLVPSICVTRTETTLASDLHSDIEVAVLGRQRSFEAGAIRRMTSLARQADVLHVHGRSSFALLATICAMGIRIPPIVLHDHFGAIESDVSVPVWFRWAHRYLSAYVGVYSKLGEWAGAAGVADAKSHVISNALDLGRFAPRDRHQARQALDLCAGQRVGILIANLRHDKGVDVLIAAMARATPSAAVVLIVGAPQDADYAQACTAAAKAAGLQDRVRFLGRRTDAAALLWAADFAIMSSRTESGPLTLIEYLACGLPIVYTPAGDIGRRLAALGVPGHVPAGDADAMARALNDVSEASTDDLQTRARRGARSLAEFDLDAVFPQWLSLYQSLT
jgi:glycosyltransferase involved in cell wall biosynthesis